MKQEIKDQWIAALESGEYEKCKYLLHDIYESKNRFCAVGVLCDLAYRAGVVDRTKVSFLDRHAYAYGRGEDSYNDCPREVIEWAGLDKNDPFVIEGTELVEINDKYDKTFPEIAVLIKEYL